jgi:phosphoribosylanthranilate isomerase
MKVKICGITTLDDALAAIDAGADLLGFNFYPRSPRSIEPAACAALVNRLRGRGERATLVGVFVNIAADAVAACLDACNLDYAQLHGDEPPEEPAALGPWAFKAIRPANTEEAKRQALRLRVGHRRALWATHRTTKGPAGPFEAMPGALS